MAKLKPHDIYWLFFATLKNRLLKDFLGPKLFFLIKIENFYQKKQLRSDRFSLARLSSEARNNA